ncbi:MULTISPECIES: ectoine synthase [Auritidibacter]|uniref:L-ectoine synthase n=1 Tax=Auritidibacter ignavus TaxID=678932 RepID=A0AAJ6AMS7_9MICC|nr:MULTISPECIES: ectoine synthase [Auritidibacter]AXR74773.1 ectoine synthase [Auritidibacter sp. NML130574]PXA78379.1 L-ectoine synthase [Auritidibacter sp. NML100628]PXA79445.1 L-ectoine synthase [Auritidibacter sp. NML120636]WGH90512.1 ectoine synthase [Auritidibacter ignavus]WGH92891.1 ectoine synthase [Auritidibacter ignavus]
MYVINRDDTNDTERDVTSENWRSRRMVLAREGVGFSMHDTVIYAGTTSTFHYQNHIEAVYCVQGNGTLTNEETGEVHELKDGTLYLLDGHEKHTVRAETELRMACVFNPPVTGRETHDENGVYPAVFEEGSDRKVPKQPSA